MRSKRRSSREAAQRLQKVNVPAGKEIKETVTVYKDDLKFYDEKAGEWYLENEYTFYVGQDSADAMNNKLTVSV